MLKRSAGQPVSNVWSSRPADQELASGHRTTWVTESTSCEKRPRIADISWCQGEVRYTTCTGNSQRTWREKLPHSRSVGRCSRGVLRRVASAAARQPWSGALEPSG